MSVKIIIDSTADVRGELRDKFIIVPLTVSFGEEQFVDGVTINHRQFYEKLVESDVMPTTSQPSPEAFERVFRELVENGDEAVVLTISSSLSGTYQSATIARENLEGKIFVVDTRSVTIGSGILAELALSLANEGFSAREIAERITKERENVRVIALLDTLEYLKRGGRISKTVAFAGGLLSIKPVLCIMDGEIAILGKARGSKQGNNFLTTEIQKSGGVNFDKPLLLGYTGLSDALLEKYKEDSQELWQPYKKNLYSEVIGSVVGTHAGPNGIAVAFFCK